MHIHIMLSVALRMLVYCSWIPAILARLTQQLTLAHARLPCRPAQQHPPAPGGVDSAASARTPGSAEWAAGAATTGMDPERTLGGLTDLISRLTALREQRLARVLAVLGQDAGSTCLAPMSDSTSAAPAGRRDSETAVQSLLASLPHVSQHSVPQQQQPSPLPAIAVAAATDGSTNGGPLAWADAAVTAAASLFPCDTPSRQLPPPHTLPPRYTGSFQEARNGSGAFTPTSAKAISERNFMTASYFFSLPTPLTRQLVSEQALSLQEDLAVSEPAPRKGQAGGCGTVSAAAGTFQWDGTAGTAQWDGTAQWEGAHTGKGGGEAAGTNGVIGACSDEHAHASPVLLTTGQGGAVDSPVHTFHTGHTVLTPRYAPLGAAEAEWPGDGTLRDSGVGGTVLPNKGAGAGAGLGATPCLNPNSNSRSNPALTVAPVEGGNEDGSGQLKVASSAGRRLRGAIAEDALSFAFQVSTAALEVHRRVLGFC